MGTSFCAITQRLRPARWTAIILLSAAVQAFASEPTEAFKFTKIDLELWDKVNQVDREFERKGLVFDDPDAVAYIEEVGMKMVPDAPLEKVTWRFRILRDSVPNAFALPNGSIYIHTGLLSMLRNEAQLASVLGHEVTHVINRHSYLENRSYRKKVATANVLSAIVGVAGGAGGIGGHMASDVLQRLVPALIFATIQGYSRELEHEADMYGLQAMARNNYPPIQMAGAFELLKGGAEVQLQKEAHGLYTDHPRLDDRIHYVSEMVDKLPLSGPPIVRVNEYNKQMERVFRHDISLQILTGRARTALVIAQRLTENNPENSEDAFLLGECYRALGGSTPRPRPEEVTDSAKSATRKQLGKLTLLEYEAALRKTPEGQAAWGDNVKSAEKAYNRALALDPQNARAVRGLAALQDEDGRFAEALDGYRKYLQMAPTAIDTYRIKKRTEDLEKTLAAGATGTVTSNR